MVFLFHDCFSDDRIPINDFPPSPTSVCVRGEPCDGHRRHVPSRVPSKVPPGALPISRGPGLLPHGPRHAYGGRCHSLGL